MGKICSYREKLYGQMYIFARGNYFIFNSLEEEMELL